MRTRRRQPLLDRTAALRVRRILYLNGLRGGEIDDAMQEIELRALEHPPRERPTAWACVVATNLAMDVHRRARRQEGVTPPVAEQAADPDVAGAAGLRDTIRTGLERLPAELRATVVLRFYADFTVPEIADAMGVPGGTVKSRLHRALSELRRFLPKEETT